MSTGAVERLFVDTNVLVYANIVEAPFHTDASAAIRTYEEQGVALWISRQIIREYLATLTRPDVFERPPDIATLQTQVQAFTQRFQIAEDGPQTTAKLLNLLAGRPCWRRTGTRRQCRCHDASLWPDSSANAQC